MYTKKQPIGQICRLLLFTLFEFIGLHFQLCCKIYCLRTDLKFYVQHRPELRTNRRLAYINTVQTVISSLPKLTGAVIGSILSTGGGQ
jgi:hypothetical protein